MDLEMVFNELSLRVLADNIQTAQQKMSDLVATARKAAELGIKPIIRTNTQFYAATLAENYSLSDWVIDRSVDRDIQRFILTAAKSPFLADIQSPEIETKTLLSEFYYEGELAEGLGIAYLLETLAISLISEKCWDCSCLELEVRQIDKNEEISTSIKEIIHANCQYHIQQHTTWIQNRIRRGVKDGTELWKRKKELFPSLEFCENVCQQLQRVRKGELILQQIIKKLSELEECCKSWTDGAFNLDNLASKASPESETRLQQFQEQLSFVCPDGKKRIFSLHLRMTGAGAWRLHFSTELGPGKIIIGYVGLKIQ
jgi:hypothetical protein